MVSSFRLGAEAEGELIVRTFGPHGFCGRESPTTFFLADCQIRIKVISKFLVLESPGDRECQIMVASFRLHQLKSTARQLSPSRL